MWQNLFHKKWRTNTDMRVGKLASGETKSELVRAFYGDYRISVLVDGSTVHSEDVKLTKATGSKEISITI